MFRMWRALATVSPLAPAGDLAAAAQILGLPIMSILEKAAAEVRAIAFASPLSAPAAAAEAAALCARLGLDNPALPLVAADGVLAARLRWPVTVPLLAAGLERGARPDAPRWPDACCAGLMRAAAGAYDLFGDIERRAQALVAWRGRLRSRGAGAVLDALLANDALAPARLPGGLSGRAGRRLFDRLAEAGVVRELTGRAAFRLYGL
jgi:hypothetical protein